MGNAQNTLPAERVPKELRNPYIMSGYRQLSQPWAYYIKSMFHIHNESVNVWSHLIGCLVLFTQIHHYYHIYEADGAVIRWTLLGHGLCCCVTLFNSATAHLIHSKSLYANFLVFMFDYIGVVHWGFGTALLAIYGVSHPDTYHWLGPNFLKWQVMWTYLTFITICMSKLWYGHDLEIGTRKRMIVVGISIQAVYNVIPWAQRYTDCYNSSGCHLSSLNHISVVCISFIIMAMTFVLHQPEKRWPGKFDIWGQSHQIFHITVIITQSLQIRALYIDYQAKANSHCEPNINELVALIAILYGSCLVTLAYMTRHIKRKIQFNASENNNAKKEN